MLIDILLPLIYSLTLALLGSPLINDDKRGFSAPRFGEKLKRSKDKAEPGKKNASEI